MTFLESMIERAQADRKVIVLPEGDDARTLEAAQKILARDVADLIILGDAEAIAASGFDLAGAQVIDPRSSELREPLAAELVELRRAKGMTPEQADALAPTAWWPAPATPPATCCAPACRSSRRRRA